MQKTVVILLSDKRSGSTMFEDELCKHPDIQHVGYTPHSYFETHHWLKGAVVLGMAAETFSGKQSYRGYGSVANARQYLIDCIQKNVPEFSVPKSSHDLVFQGWDVLCERFAKPVFFEKSPQLLSQWAGLSLLLEWIESTDYKVKIIGLTRNPLSVMYSAQKLFHTQPAKRQYGWLEGQKNLLAMQALISDEDFLNVKYEEIIDNPKEVFAEVCRFIGIPEDCMIGDGVHARSVNKWKNDPEFTLQLDEGVKQIARKFGYSEDELVNPNQPGIEKNINARSMLEVGYTFFRAYLRNRIIKPILLRLKQH